MECSQQPSCCGAVSPRDVNAVDQTGQTALHWSAVRGSIQVAELLLQNGANLEIADSHGYRITHVAAQYGQTALLYHVATKWGAEIDAVDNDGRSPLHWAAYKGFGDCIRLLLFMDAYLQRQDMEGCTALHWAAIRGNLEACTVLVQAGSKENLTITDARGCTPAQLASDKGHRQVALFLSNARRVFNNRWDSKGLLGKVAKLGLAPALWLLIITMISINIAAYYSICGCMGLALRLLCNRRSTISVLLQQVELISHSCSFSIHNSQGCLINH
ncbi:hypothetical protein O6H91_09G084000 [Diphasiastrum complanatum]|uniref:Uncharacterized protein n=1 Tax=Diphasiastrum complanatum TaxID=34168 RepID=A0ACC2CRL2_DIPCM|nr:hypothetical protein O6H91_09G084000 [Diphasiastrum complanatum]